QEHLLWSNAAAAALQLRGIAICNPSVTDWLIKA
uniref:Uncharacterized protein n=1 Tax=Aegilops tauschii subsp. strangulata TaxID=200361 RepID=A0A453DK54_AEGTS